MSTCSTGSNLRNIGIPNEHFDAVFIDECGSAWEPEVLSCFVSLLKYDGQLVLAGDPKQLGPVTFSVVAKQFGLGTSMLERLCEENELYTRHPEQYEAEGRYNSKYITKLVYSYRCHPRIMEIPNKMFYDNDLVCKASPAIANNLCEWRYLPNANDFPLIFHNIEGENVREANSPSWFNVAEVEQVVDYVRKLVIETRAVTAAEIGIISPYQKQVHKIKLALKLSSIPNYANVFVGSCEQIQGQERRVIIISTVRSNVNDFKFDEKYDIGFVSHPQRFNVAITRAQALLIMIGSEKVLRSSDLWNSMIEYCQQNGALIGHAESVS